jgi:hypothetical protein
MLTFILASARHYWRGHLGLLLGAFLASAILAGSLFVGDSVRASLRRIAAQRLGKVQSGVLGGDRWFTQKLATDSGSVPLIFATGSASAGNGSVRVNGAQILGIEAGFASLSPAGDKITLGNGEVAVNEPLARKLNIKVGDSILLRLERPSAISRDAPLSGSTNESRFDAPFRKSSRRRPLARFSSSPRKSLQTPLSSLWTICSGRSRWNKK